MTTNEKKIGDLMQEVHTGKAQLPEFQRKWVWDDRRIRALAASVVRDFPIGAVMFLQYGNENVQFQSRTIAGVPEKAQDVTPEYLILDGQQRLTALYGALYSDQPVETLTEKKKPVARYYYVDMEKALDPDADDEDLILSVPESRQVTSDFGKKVDLDLSTPELEYEKKLFPLNAILHFGKFMKWQNGFSQYHHSNPDVAALVTQFGDEVAAKVQGYMMPVISLGKDTPREAVCRVFENVNTGGVSLTVFELVTAIYAMGKFNLREDWDARKTNAFSGAILAVITETDFLTALTLYASWNHSVQDGGKTPVTCKKKDVLKLPRLDYQQYADPLTAGFREAEKLLLEECVFSAWELPYTTQLIPLAVICAALGKQVHHDSVRKKIRQWYWCGVFGELYGSANESRFAYDVADVVNWVNGGGDAPKTCKDCHFSPMRLLSMRSRLSAAYKGVMALVLKNGCRDFISGSKIDLMAYNTQKIDIHHIFPQSYCKTAGLPWEKWQSVVNKTPLSAATNREIGGAAPSKYLEKIAKKGQASPEAVDQYLASHWIDPASCRADDFSRFLTARAARLLNAIQDATGRPITGRDSEEVQQAFGGKLL